jgi:fumarate reductase subunit D
MREVGRALALDPSQADAVRALVDLLTNPPKHPPKPVLEQARRDEDRLAQSAARGAALTFFVVFLATPLAWFMGVSSYALSIGGALLAAAASALCLWVARSGPTRARRAAIVTCALLGLATLSRIFGPFLVVPQLALALMAGLVLYPRAYSPLVTVGGTTGAVLVPVLLELLGVVEPSYVFTGTDRLCIRSHAVAFPAIPTTAHLVVVSCGAIVGTAVYLYRVRSRLDHAQMQMRIYAWQLRQIVSDGRSGAG